MKVSLYAALVALVVLGVVVEDVIGQNNKVKRKPHRIRDNGRRGNGRRGGRRGGRGNRGGGRGGRTTRQPPTPLPCPPIPHISNGQATPLGSASAQAACNPGFRLVGTNVISCVNGQWVTLPRCERATCPSPPFVPFANPARVQDNMATYTCLTAEYQLSGGPAMCNTNSLMWQNLPTCTRIPTAECPAPPAIANAVSTRNGQMATYTCNTGYRLVGTTTIMCTNNMWPTAGLPSCVADPTTPVTQNSTCSNVPGGDQFAVRPSLVADSYTPGSHVTFTCVSGYRIVGSNSNTNTSANIYCTSNGTWTMRPTCEPVVCGLPPSGVQTTTVSTTCITYRCMYTYVCNMNYEFTGTLLTTCNADGKWSLPAPTCTAKMCMASALPTLPFSTHVSANYPIGTVVNYTCNANYRLAPGLPMSTATVQTTTCQSDGTYTPLASTCVHVNPTDCKDYFRRDNLFATTAVGTCATVTLDPQGPNLADPTNPPAFQAMCCKRSATQCCTEVAPTTGTSVAPDGSACAATSSTLFPGATFAAAGDSFACGTPTTTGYSLSNAQIAAMVASSNGSCSQRVTITCTTASNSDYLILRCNGQAGGRAYGTNAIATSLSTAFTTVPAGTPYHGLGGVCDCATGATTPTGACADGGCVCTDSIALTAGGTDTITKPITSDNLGYVNALQVATIETGGAWDGFSAAVGPITCCDTV